MGVGEGDAELSDAAGSEATDLSLTLAALGVRRELDSPAGRFGLAVKGDVYAGRLQADGSGPWLPETEARSQRARLLLEGSLDLSVSEASVTRLLMEAGARWDGGDEAGGGGLEIGLTLVHRRPGAGLEILADGRYTALHRDDGLEDASVGLGIAWDPGVGGQGLRVSLAPSWGSAAVGGALDWLTSGSGGWRPPGPGVAGGPSRWGLGPSRYEAELGYGWPEGAGRMRDIHASASDAGRNGRDYGLGLRFTLGGRLIPRWMLDLELVRSERALAAPENGVRLTIGRDGLRFGRTPGPWPVRAGRAAPSRTTPAANDGGP